MSREIGFLAEQLAFDYLVAQGLRAVDSNFSCRMGEIDLIMLDKSHLVFIEVRKRSSNRFGNALASITESKKKKLIKAAMLYLSVNKAHEKQPIRFDVLSIQGDPSDIIWVKNAFGADF